ncbi:MAG: valine--pyruvate transaminase [Gammaproteobacteria bacterium]|nr:valine--pyruvate transaminase [Gammaproteobacteria bacterium]
MKLSAFGEKFGSTTGIQVLMDDIGDALASGRDMILMGGGNPASIPAVEAVFQARMARLAAQPELLNQVLGSYDPPQGNATLINDLAALFRQRLGWQVSARNIALTNGSQAGFFMLFNMFAGPFKDGTQRQIQLPLAPEYIGYADAGLGADFFAAAHPQIDQLGQREFKYRVCFDELEIGDQTGAICVSRPTNPTGNVITDEEVEHLDALAQANDIPLIIDGAYGVPFPGLIFTQATPFWNQNTIVCLSLSKLGLPTARTGIVVANEEVIQTVARTNAIINLASGNFGALLTQELVHTGEIIDLSNQVVRPYYEQRLDFVKSLLHREMDNTIPWAMHKPEGTMFTWMWFKDLPISSQELYERLKARDVIVVSGHHFFIGIKDDWQHRHECIRVNYAAQTPERIEKGIKIIAEEVRKAYLG